MKKFSTWMILLLGIIFWLLRIVAVYTDTMGMEFMIKPLDTNTEIALLFISLLAFILIAKRKFLGVIIYIVEYWGYFGVDLFTKLTSETPLAMEDVISVFFSFIGILLPIFSLLDLALDKNRKNHPKDKKTDWFYKDEKFDRNMDERADKNNYRTL